MLASRIVPVYVLFAATLPTCFAQGVVDVCAAIRSSGSQSITIRGTGRFAPDGLVMGDLTCPVAKSGDINIPAIILVEVHSFAASQPATNYDREKKRSSAEDPLVQMVVEGKLTCRELKFRRSDDQQIVEGDGFGSRV